MFNKLTISDKPVAPVIGELQLGKKYKWKSQPEVMVYIGKEGIWYQFELVGEPGEVWCETLEEFMEYLEEVV